VARPAAAEAVQRRARVSRGVYVLAFAGRDFDDVRHHELQLPVRRARRDDREPELAHLGLRPAQQGIDQRYGECPLRYALLARLQRLGWELLHVRGKWWRESRRRARQPPRV